MNLKELQNEIYDNKKRRGFNVSDVGKEVVLMVEELGELARAVKKHDKEDMIDAVGDLMVYCLGLCEILGVDAQEVLEKIVEKNKTREHTGYIPEKTEDES
jgi:NTP pyrophosphatase (non-canonical NTP hydrolase)